MNSRFCVILAGGSGQRLWPLSRSSRPKQLVPVLHGQSLLEIAFERIEGVVPTACRWVCAGARYEAVVREKLPELECFIGEPCGRDTLAAVALSCAYAYAMNPEAVVAFLTADHMIRPVESFKQSLSEAFHLVEANPDILLTFGIRPSYAATGYGYLELGGKTEETAFHVRRFKEKPDKKTAEGYLLRGPHAYLWNSGMFVWKASRFLELLEKYEPEVARHITTIRATIGTAAYAHVLAETYPVIVKKSVDYGIMEPASRDSDVRIACLPLNLEWMDVGSWNAYAALGVPDRCGNTAMLAYEKAGEGQTIFLDSAGTLAVSTEPDHLIACFGCEDMVIVHTKDATLVCPKPKAEELKTLYAKAMEQGWG